MKKKGKILVLILCAAALFTACGRSVQPKEGNIFIYCLNADRTGLEKVEYEIPEDKDNRSAAQAVLEKLRTPSDNIDYTAPLPKNVKILSVDLKGSILEVNFSKEYNDTGRLEEKLIRAAVVQSLLEISGINAVAFNIEDHPLCDAEGNQIGLMNEDDFVCDTSSSPSAYQTDTLTLYFANKTGDRLIAEKTDVRYNSNISKEKLIVEKLMKGPETEEVRPTINPNTSLLSVTVKDGICYVNFDNTFLTGGYDVLPEVTVYSIVNSLVEGTGADMVQITINGESDEKYMETVDLSKPLKANETLIAAENGE